MNGGVVNCDIDFPLLAGEDFMKIEMLVDWAILAWIENCHRDLHNFAFLEDIAAKNFAEVLTGVYNTVLAQFHYFDRFSLKQ